MESAAGFLLGGAVGAALGFLLSRKALRKTSGENTQPPADREALGATSESATGLQKDIQASDSTTVLVAQPVATPASQEWPEPAARAVTMVEEAAPTEAPAEAEEERPVEMPVGETAGETVVVAPTLVETEPYAEATLEAEATPEDEANAEVEAVPEADAEPEAGAHPTADGAFEPPIGAVDEAAAEALPEVEAGTIPDALVKITGETAFDALVDTEVEAPFVDTTIGSMTAEAGETAPLTTSLPESDLMRPYETVGEAVAGPETSVLAEPGREEAGEPEYPAGASVEPDVVVTPEVLEEPLPGSGWGPSSAVAVDEATIEDILPVGSDVALPHVSMELESEAPEQGEHPIVDWFEESAQEPVGEAEEEATEGSAGIEPIVEPFSGEPAAATESVGIGSAMEEPLLDEHPPESSTIEPPVYEVPAAAQSVPQVPIMEEPVYEIPLPAEPMSEMPVLAELPMDSMPAVDTVQIDDLKTRIEETRRRIRRELEHPFVTMEEAKTLEADWTSSPAIAAAGPIETPEPRPTVEPGGPVLETGADPAEALAATEEQEPMDYELMKSRIEATRSRLKAKAFDAMMAGESALLGRDEEAPEHVTESLPAVDKEIDESIESSLREEES